MLGGSISVDAPFDFLGVCESDDILWSLPCAFSLGDVLLGALSFVPLVKIYQYSASNKTWALNCKISMYTNMMVVVYLLIIGGLLLDMQSFRC